MKLKHAYLICLAGWGIMGSASAADPAKPVSAYEQAVSVYVESVGKELGALREQVDATVKNASPEVKERYTKFYAGLDQCDQLYAELKKAAAKDFDSIKARYEKQRAETVKSLSEAAKR